MAMKRKNLKRRLNESGPDADISQSSEGNESAKVAKQCAFEALPQCFEEYFRCSKLLEPVTVQKHVWPRLVQGKDLMVLAPTGSGKTLSYLLPMLSVVIESKKSGLDAPSPGHPLGLVFVPTRELAIQVYKVVKSFKRLFSVRSLVTYGGKDRGSQIEKLAESSGIDILVSTPGRCIDFLNAKLVSFTRVVFLVLDEADRMLDMGFEPHITKLVSFLPRKRPGDVAEGSGRASSGFCTQNVLTSATFADKLHGVVRNLNLLTNDPEVVIVKSNEKEEVEIQSLIPLMDVENPLKDSKESSDGNGSTTAHLKDKAASRQWTSSTKDQLKVDVNSNIEQIVQVCAEHKKPRKLIRFIEKIRKQDEDEKLRNTSSILIFCGKIKTVKFVEKFLRERNGMKQTAMLHSQITQSIREKTMNDFRAGKVKILIATDVVGRGVDIKGLRYVISYDFPSSLTAYVHRIGRTGRQAKSGTAISFFTRNLRPIAKDLVQWLRDGNQVIDSYLLQLVNEEPAK